MRSSSSHSVGAAAPASSKACLRRCSSSSWPPQRSVPKGGEVVTLSDYRFTVVDVEKNRISKVRVEKPGTVLKPRTGTTGPIKVVEVGRH